MRMTTDTLYYGNYRFVVEFDSGSETGSNQLTVWVAEKADIDAVPLKQFGAAQLPKSDLQRLEVEFARWELWLLDRRCYDRDILQAQSRAYGEEFSLRVFYFEEANDPHIRNFCRKARDFFCWVNAHVEEILALPEYQRLEAEDSAFQPSAGELDPLIRPAVEALNRIPGVTTRFSCQGVSGKVRFQGRELLVVSPHEEYAYVSFSDLPQPARDVIAALLPSFPGVTDARIPCNFADDAVLRSTGDNLRFRQELVELAERALASVGAWSTNSGESGLPWEASTAAAVGSQDGPAPGGIPPSRLAWLCQPERIERTLHLLFSLNHWATARERLLYADRQGLYRVKAAVVQQACAAGLLNPVSYIDGRTGFAREFSLDLAADIATGVFIERLVMLIEDDEYLPANEEESNSAALDLFARIMGRRPASRADIEALDGQGTRAFIQERLQALVAEARSTRQPIPEGELAALCLEPGDLLDIHWSRNRPSPRWDELDESETVQLDPEGLSLIAFEYAGATAHYIFHLPFRTAERFLPQPLVRDLKSRPGNSRECGEFFGRTITGEESREQPLGEILRALGVDVAAVCPYRLADKNEFVSQLASRYPYWDVEEGDEDDEEDWLETLEIAVR
jgi:hypothetical protein